MLNYKKLLIWQKGIDIAVKTIVFAKTLPPDEKFGLSIQMHKAGISIPSNIAEGSSRKSQKDYYRFIEIALGSAFELETQVLISQAVNYGDAALRAEILQELGEEQKMLAVFARKLIQTPVKTGK